MSGNFTVPVSATTNTVLRLRVIDDLVTISGGCHNPIYGQAEDYPVYLPQLTVLAANLTALHAQWQNDFVELKWSTSQEGNLKNFEIEKSTDGVEFYRIGVQPAAGQGANYSFKDISPNDVNYYRLRMNDGNGNSLLSKVVLVKNEAASQRIWVISNPFNDHLDLQMTNTEKRLKMQLLTVAGGVVAQKEIINPSYQVSWWLPNHLSKGVYILKLMTDQNVITYKLIKE